MKKQMSNIEGTKEERKLDNDYIKDMSITQLVEDFIWSDNQQLFKREFIEDLELKLDTAKQQGRGDVNKFLKDRIKSKTKSLVDQENFCGQCSKTDEGIYPCQTHQTEWYVINETNQILLDLDKLHSQTKEK